VLGGGANMNSKDRKNGEKEKYDDVR